MVRLSLITPPQRCVAKASKLDMSMTIRLAISDDALVAFFQAIGGELGVEPIRNWTPLLRGSSPRSPRPIVEIERANGRWPFGVAATDFTALIEGGISPQPHAGFIEVFG